MVFATWVQSVAIMSPPTSTPDKRRTRTSGITSVTALQLFRTPTIRVICPGAELLGRAGNALELCGLVADHRPIRACRFKPYDTNVVETCVV